MPVFYNNSAAWGDFDNDGDLDLALSGTDGSNHVGISVIYRNNGGGSFTDILAGLDPLNVSSVAWGDYDRDGDLDLALCGLVTGSIARSHIYRNNGNGTFSNINAGLAGCYVWWPGVISTTMAISICL